MPLDASLYALALQPRAGSTGWIDLSAYASGQDGQRSPAYSLYKDANGSYSLYDPFTDALLGTSGVAPPSLPNASPNPKHRLTRLFDPDLNVHIWNQAGISWSWSMEWEETQYVWTREVASLLGSDRAFTLSVNRKPDPNFPVLQYRPHRKGDTIEILDHNIARVEPAIRDRKGFEVAAVLALAFFIDHVFPAPAFTAAPPGTASASKPSSSSAGATPTAAPAKDLLDHRRSSRPPSPKRSPPSPVKASPRIQVTDVSPRALDAHCKYCLALLEDRHLAGLVLTSELSAHEQALTLLAERIQRKRLKATRGSDALQVSVTASESAGTAGDARPAAPSGLWAYLTGSEQSKQPEANEAAVTIRLLRQVQVESSETKRTQPSKSPPHARTPAARARTPSSGPQQSRGAEDGAATARASKVVVPAPTPSPPTRPRHSTPNHNAQRANGVERPPAAASQVRTAGGSWFSAFGRRTSST